MQILIVEDEELAVKKLQKTLLAVDSTANVIGVTDSIKATVDWLNENERPDLILMDIELADGQSFEVFNLTEVKSPVIFTTSYDEYALKAFKVNSVDYLLKPIQKDELQAAWTYIESITNSWKSSNMSNVLYEAGTWGPGDLILDENVGPYSKLSVKTKTRVGSSCPSRFRLLIFGPDSDSKSYLTW